MLVRELRRLLPFLVPLLVIVFLALRLYDGSLVPLPSFNNPPPARDPVDESPASERPQHQILNGHPVAGYAEGAYREIFSVSTADKKFFPIEFDRQRSINPNVIPHPFLDNTWIIVSQLQRSSVKKTVWFAELVCNAVFKNGALSCVDPPMILPISKTPVGSPPRPAACPPACANLCAGRREVPG
jgi:hypothetical protein